MNTIGFPGFGINDFDLNPVAFNIFGLDIAWYGLIITTGIVLAVLYAYFTTKKDKMILDDLLDIVFCIVIPGIIGARLYYVFFDWLKNPYNYSSFTDVINIRGGGLAIYGGLIFGALGGLVMLKIKKVRIFKFFDNIVPGVMLAQSLGRWGNFFNAEAFGSETTLPWRMRLTYPNYSIEVHPTFLYESLWNLTGFILIHTIFMKRKKYDGQILLLYISWYGLGRMMIEGLRTDSLYIGNTGIRVSQLLAFLCLVVGVALLIYFTVISKKPIVADCIYHEGTAKCQKVMGLDTDADKKKTTKDNETEETDNVPDN